MFVRRGLSVVVAAGLAVAGWSVVAGRAAEAAVVVSPPPNLGRDEIPLRLDVADRLRVAHEAEVAGLQPGSVDRPSWVPSTLVDPVVVETQPGRIVPTGMTAEEFSKMPRTPRFTAVTVGVDVPGQGRGRAVGTPVA